MDFYGFTAARNSLQRTLSRYLLSAMNVDTGQYKGLQPPVPLLHPLVAKLIEMLSARGGQLQCLQDQESLTHKLSHYLINPSRYVHIVFF